MEILIGIVIVTCAIGVVVYGLTRRRLSDKSQTGTGGRAGGTPGRADKD